MKHNIKTKGYILGAVAAATYGMNPLFALPLYAQGMNPDSVLFFRYLFAIPLLGIMLKTRGHSFRIRRREIFPLLLMGLLVSVSSLTLFASYHYMDVGIASTLLFVYPLLVSLLMMLAFGERLTLQTSLCMALALGGIALLYKSSDGHTLSLTGTGLVFLSALSYALYIVGVNRPGLRAVPTLKATFYILLSGLFLFIVRFLIGSPLILPPSDHWYLWGNMVGLAVFPTAISFLCTTAAVQYIGSTPTAILGALEPVTAVFFGVFVFGEALTLRVAAGLVIIVLAVTLVISGGSVTPALIRFRKLFPRLPLRRKQQ